jgi:MFS family permease
MQRRRAGAGLPAGVRRVVALVAVVVFVDTMFYAALAPILPDLEEELGLGKAGSGVLVGSYPVAQAFAALPAGWLAARHGARALVLVGLVVMSSAGVLFALADSTWLLNAARFTQGLGGICSWTAGLAWIAQVAPDGRRAELLGFGIGAGIVGAQFGPALGTLAHATGRDAAFMGAALLGVPLIVWTLRTAPAAVRTRATGSPRLLARDAPFRAALWLTLLPSLAFGAAEVLLPLRMDEVGAGALAIGAAFFVAAGVEAVVSPVVGRIADLRGVAPLIRWGALLAAACLLLLTVPESPLPLAALFVLASGGLGALWVPAGSAVSITAERLGVDQGWAFALSNLAWSAGVAAGALGGGGLGQAAGDLLPYALIAAVLLASVALVLRLLETPAAPAPQQQAPGPIRPGG